MKMKKSQKTIIMANSIDLGGFCWITQILKRRGLISEMPSLLPWLNNQVFTAPLC